MKNLILVLTLFVATIAIARADDLDPIQGKWTVNKTGDNGPYTQTLEFKKNKWVFKIVAGGSTIFASEGNAEVKKQGPFSTLRLYNIQAGRSEGALDPVEEERSIIFIVGDGRLHVAANFDKLRENEKPSAETYSKVN